MTAVESQSMHAEAVSHARIAARAAELSWKHLRSEFTQDIDLVLSTLASDEPLVWTLPVEHEGGAIEFLTGTNIPEVRRQYENLRQNVDIFSWEPIVELRQGWYTLTHGVVEVESLETRVRRRQETVTMFPIATSSDTILGEVQVGPVGVLRENRWPEVPSEAGEVPLPMKRLEALAFHDTFLDALRTGDVSGAVQTHRANGAVTIRNYLTAGPSLLNAAGADALAAYYTGLFEKFHVVDVHVVNRLVDTWYVFADLHWVVEERATERAFEFCTAEISTLDPDGRYWVRTGAGSDPVEIG